MERELIERDSITYEGATVKYEVHRSRRRKKTAQITMDDGVVRVAVPWNAKTSTVRKIVREKAEWIISRLAELAQLEEEVSRIERGTVHHHDTPVMYEIRRSKRRKKSVGFNLENGVLQVVAPARADSDSLREMVRVRAHRYVRPLSLAPPEGVQKRFVSGEYMPYMGEYVRIIIRTADIQTPLIRFDGVSGSEQYEWVQMDTVDVTPGVLQSRWLFRRTSFGDQLEDGRFRVSVPQGMKGRERYEAVRAAFVSWYMERAEEKVAKCVDYWWPMVGRKKKPRVIVRDQRRQWGSCACDNTLRFNWRLIMLEPDLIEYVVAHELAHVRVRSHSPRFWDRVADMVGDFERRREQLHLVEGILPL